MKTINLTKDFQVSRLGFGCMSLSPGVYKQADGYSDEQGVALVRAAIAAGVTHIDTALVYAWATARR